MTDIHQPNYNIYFDRDNITDALTCMNTYGYCVIRGMIDQGMVETLKDSIDETLDPKRDMPANSNRNHLAFAEVSKPLWKLVEHAPYMNFMHQALGSKDLCLHRSATILRTAGEPFGRWHTDTRADRKTPREASDFLNCHGLPSGAWFYLNGSHPESSGIAVIEKSHAPDWEGPKGFELTPNRNSFHPIGEADDANYKSIDVPGCVPIIADPGDLICFADRTYHTNMATHERRYSCTIMFRPKSIKIDAPWPLPASAREMAARLPEHLKGYTEGYTGYDGEWRAD